jgi:hypothetical protein
MYIYIYLTAIGLTPSGSNTSHIYIQNSTHNTGKGKFGKCRPCPVFASYTLAFALQLRKKHGKTSVRVAKYKNNEQVRTESNLFTFHTSICGILGTTCQTQWAG